jgi:YegS/Rv2252/BmrU family lipid kinase
MPTVARSAPLVARALRLIVNPHAGGGRALRTLPAVKARLRELGVAFSTERTTSLEHGRALAVAAADAGEVAVSFSGDGLAGAVAGALAGRDGAVMGVLPGGRGNDFARVLGLPLEPVAACEVLAQGHARPVDLGLAGGRPFVGIASLGFDSDANRIANQAPPRLGNLVYLYGALRALLAWKPATFTVSVDGLTRTVTGWSVGAANSKAYGGGMYAAPTAELDDGALDVVVVRRTSKARFVAQVLPRVFKGTHVELPYVDVLRGAEVRIAADRPFTVYADGDPIAELPVTITVAPAAVRVLAPPR